MAASKHRVRAVGARSPIHHAAIIITLVLFLNGLLLVFGSNQRVARAT
jgi:hypothetical protein